MNKKTTHIGIRVKDADRQLLDLYRQALLCFGIQGVKVEPWTDSASCLGMPLDTDVGGIPGEDFSPGTDGFDLFCLLNKLFGSTTVCYCLENDMSVGDAYPRDEYISERWVFSPDKMAVFTESYNYSGSTRTIWNGEYKVPYDGYFIGRSDYVLGSTLEAAGTLRGCGKIRHITVSGRVIEALLDMSMVRHCVALTALILEKLTPIPEKDFVGSRYTLTYDREILEDRKSEKSGVYRVSYNRKFKRLLLQLGRKP